MHLAMKSSVRSRSAALSIGRYTGIVLIVVTARHSAPPNVLMRCRITPRACLIATGPEFAARQPFTAGRPQLLTFTNTTSAPVGLTNERAANRGSSASKPVWTGRVSLVVMQHGSSSIAESRRAADGMESIAARLRIDVLWALLRDNRTWAPAPPALSQAA